MAKKRDINLLESLNQSNKKKSSSSMTAVLAVAIIVLIGAMVFLFASAKVQTSKNNEIITGVYQCSERVCKQNFCRNRRGISQPYGNSGEKDKFHVLQHSIRICCR